MSSSDLNLNNIGFQSNLRSKPNRENFGDIENNFNALRADFLAGGTSTAGEVVNARDNYSLLVDNVHIRRVYNNRISTNTDFQTSESSPAALSVDVTSGQGIVYGTGINATSGTISISVPSAGKKRIDCVIVDNANTLSVLPGAEVNATGSASFPSIAQTEMILSHYTIYDTATSILNARIIDDRLTAIDPFLDEGNYPTVKFNYSGATLASAHVYDQNNDLRSYKYSYTADLISSVGVTIDSVRFLQNYAYIGDTLSTITNTIG
jgi:hypothetical protein